QHAVDHREVYLKEYTIATEVFGRDRNYDSRNDSVVRVQAGRLRSKLHEYYATEGKNDEILIDLPKGHYAPVFTTNARANGSAIGNDLESLRSADYKSTARWWRTIAVGLALLSLALVLALGYRSESRRQNGSRAPGPLKSDSNDLAYPLWGDLLRSNQPVLVAFSNIRFRGTAETGMKLIKPLTTPQSEFEPSRVEGAASRNSESDQVITEHYTGVGEVMGVFSLSDIFCRFGQAFRLKRSLLLNWEDLKTENIVILGSPAENILIRDLPQKQDFVFGLVKDEGQRTAFGLANTKPQSGEQRTYLAKQEGPSRSQISEDFALISLLRGLESEHRLLILAGITTFGTQAAAEYVTKPEYIRELIAHLNTSPSGKPPSLPAYYQILVKVKVNEGVPVQISYVTHHVLE